MGLGEERRAADGIWKFIAMLAVGVVLGGAPNYISLLIAQHSAITISDVDHEVAADTSGLSQKLDDLKEQMNEIRAEISEKRTFSQNTNRH